MADTPEAVRKSVRLYLTIGAILFIGTILTVLVATVPALDMGKHGFDSVDCLIGLAIASTKAALVAAIFMHLNHEKKAIYWIFGSGLIFVTALFALTALAKNSPIFDKFFYSGGPAMQAPASPAAPGH